MNDNSDSESTDNGNSDTDSDQNSERDAQTFNTPDDVPDDALVLQCGKVVDGQTGEIIGRLDRDGDGA